MKWNSLRQFGHDGLGPIANTYMYRLHASLRQCDGGDHKILFALRAGVRIHDLYQTWLAARNVDAPTNMALLKASRMMSIKAAYAPAAAIAVTALGRELAGAQLNDVIKSVLNPEIASGRCPELPEIPPAPIHEFLEQENEVARFVKRYLNRQSELYASYLTRLVGEAERVILVDSGWRGTTQLLLEAAFPNYKWEGVYFGCIGRGQILGRRPGPMHGLMFDSEVYAPEKPETAFLLHRHLIESLFEPGIPSVEQIEPGDVGAPLDGAELMRKELRESWDDVYEGARAYLTEHAADPLSKTVATYHATMERLANTLCQPSRDDVLYACGKVRSHDLGRTGEVTSVLPAKDRFDGDTPELRIKEAIWQTGQAILEFPEKRARAIQKKLVTDLMASEDKQYFVAPTDAAATVAKGAGHVAIITRTKDRPLLLKRAAESVASQSHASYSWVIVNDGGNLEDVLDVVKASAVDPAKVTICSNERSLGMEAASNVGIRTSASDYIVIHDDDDSWHPDFLKETVGFLEENRLVYGGVITKTLYVSEEISGKSVVEHGRWPYNDWVTNVHLSEMLIGNFFAPIAFVFRRSICEEIGGFDQTLPVLGDWDFNLRFLMRADIGVVPQTLAYYHHRDRGAGSGSYSNSVIGGSSRHTAYNAIVRNKYIRLAAQNNEFAALSVLMGTSYGQHDIRHRLENVRQHIAAVSSGPSTNHRLLDELAAKVEKQQLELDQRWIMLQLIAKEYIAARGLNVSPDQLIQKILDSIDEHATRLSITPPTNFDEAEYLRQHPDVAREVSEGKMPSAFDHYWKWGRKEGRRRTVVA